MLYDPKWEKPATKTEPWRNLLLAAADVLEKRGHAKNSICDQHDRVCLIGALNLAGTGHPFRASLDRESAVGAIARHLEIRKHDAGPALVGWNNKPERTINEVTAAFRSAAAE